MVEPVAKKTVISVSAVLCLVPTAIVGISTDLFWWEWLTVVPISILLLGLPQVTMFFVALSAKRIVIRNCSLAISGIALATFVVLQLGIDPTSSSTAVLSYFFAQLVILPFAAAAIGIVSWSSPTDS